MTYHNYPKEKFHKGEYDSCTFIECDLSYVDFSSSHFIDCIFEHCDISNAKLIDTSLSDIIFQDCKMLGLHFEHINPLGFSVTFKKCQLSYSSFFKLKLKNTLFEETQLQEVDFSSANLSNAKFDDCDLARTLFTDTNLQGADFRTAYNYTIDPSENIIKQAKFSLIGLPGLLRQYDINIDLDI